ncbi:MAG TPA: TauD/TfdA family dioxygenase [Stellaceae bacterium]|nr:TauD/TfdA family dioxygenase [Stellaceae bacterium]
METRETSVAGWIVGPPLSPAGGVRIFGADLSRPLPPELLEAIRAALLRHHVVVFPGQSLSREQQFRFAASLGEVEPPRPRGAEVKRHGVAHVISNLDEDGNPVARSSPSANDHWHTDKPYHPIPPALTTLYAVELPPQGGDTEFANTAHAYAALPEPTRRRIAPLRVVFRAQFATGPQQPTAVHPLLRTHPETGHKALYLGNHAAGILGLPEADGRALLSALLEQATQRRFVYTHRWSVGDLVMWDNRCLLHRALANFDRTRHRRILHRSLVKGTAPF